MRLLANLNYKRIILRMLLIAARILALAYILICVYLYIAQRHYIFFPDSTMIGTPDDANLKWKDVSLTTSDGVKIHAWSTYADKPVGWVLICHGNAGNISYLVFLVEYFAREHHLNSLIFDYRGYGKSEGVPSEKGLYIDVRTAYDYMVNTEGADPSKIVLMGHSLGGAVATELATQVKCAGLVIESSFTSVPDLAQRIYFFLPARLLSRYDFNSLKKIPRITVPKMIVHGVMDQVIPFDMGQSLFNAATEPKQFVEIPGTHNEADFIDWQPYNDAWTKLLKDAGLTE